MFIQARATAAAGSDAADEVDEDVLLVEILRWFKCDFFRWVDKPKCNNCTVDDCVERKFDNNRAFPTPNEKQGLASRVELYKCSNCNNELRFPR